MPTKATKASPRPSVAKPKTFGEALAAVLHDIKSMEKLDTNKHGGYDYVPVDDVYDAVRPILAKHGITVVQGLTASRTFEADTAKGRKPETWIEQEFCYSLVYGEEVHHGIGGNTCVARLSMGSQSCGSNASYSMKTFLRSTFLIPMGEYDIDSGEHEEELAKGSKSSRRGDSRDDAPSEASGDNELSEDAVSDFVQRFSGKLNDCRSADDVDNVYRDNKKTIKRLPQGTYDAVIEACKQARETFLADIEKE